MRMSKYCFGIDVGGTTIKCALFLNDGTILDKWEIKTNTDNGGERILPDIADGIEAKLKEKKIDKAEVEGIGIGLPGPIEENGEIACAVNLHWGRKNIEKELNELTGMAVKAGNDANVAALGEMWQGGGKGYKNLVMVTLGTGVGGGVIIDEKILPGAVGAAGEIGHIPMRDDETETCGCGKKGCLEQYASATGIVRLTRRYLEAHKDEDVQTMLKDDYTAKDIFDAAKLGDKVALAMVDEVGLMLGKALASIACVVNPEAFVIGGGMAKAGEILLNVIRKYYTEYAFHAARDTVFKEAELSNNAGIYGGVRLVLE